MQTLVDRLKVYFVLTRLHRPIGILLLLWPTLWALWIAGAGRPDALIVAVFVAGVVLMRSAGCVINDIADRKIDPHVARTKDRPIAAGVVGVREALAVFAFLLALAFGLALLLNWQTLAMAPVGAFLAASYPFMKRFTPLPQVYLGVAFAWAIPMAFMAQMLTLPPMAWWLFAITVIWAVIYDTEYAMVDRDDDLKIGVKSSAIFFGRWDRLAIGLLQVVMVIGLACVGKSLAFGVPYYFSVAMVGALFGYQQWLIRRRDRDGCFRAFLHNHWVGLCVFGGILIEYLLPLH